VLGDQTGTERAALTRIARLERESGSPERPAA
jgi:hypothetical protein